MSKPSISSPVSQPLSEAAPAEPLAQTWTFMGQVVQQHKNALGQLQGVAVEQGSTVLAHLRQGGSGPLHTDSWDSAWQSQKWQKLVFQLGRSSPAWAQEDVTMLSCCNLSPRAPEGLGSELGSVQAQLTPPKWRSRALMVSTCTHSSQGTMFDHLWFNFSLSCPWHWDAWLWGKVLVVHRGDGGMLNPRAVFPKKKPEIHIRKFNFWESKVCQGFWVSSSLWDTSHQSLLLFHVLSVSVGAILPCHRTVENCGEPQTHY